MIVSRPTVVATIRWPCSQNRLPTIFGKSCPFESGQSDVASPASWLVTNAPAMIKQNVAPATRMAKRFRPLFMSLPISTIHGPTQRQVLFVTLFHSALGAHFVWLLFEPRDHCSFRFPKGMLRISRHRRTR